MAALRFLPRESRPPRSSLQLVVASRPSPLDSLADGDRDRRLDARFGLAGRVCAVFEHLAVCTDDHPGHGQEGHRGQPVHVRRSWKSAGGRGGDADINSSPRRLAASSPRRLAASSPRRLAASSPRRLAASPPRRLAAPLPCTTWQGAAVRGCVGLCRRDGVGGGSVRQAWCRYDRLLSARGGLVWGSGWAAQAGRVQRAIRVSLSTGSGEERCERELTTDWLDGATRRQGHDGGGAVRIRIDPVQPGTGERQRARYDGDGAGGGAVRGGGQLRADGGGVDLPVERGAIVSDGHVYQPGQPAAHDGVGGAADDVL
ncbi:uncharacterized protein PFL1_05250 [Pseudozyma flocculosa PF-1]|uniref:Uncharacterized protein n=1 Tax=Pseudozyma flocculosa PF-1 TaxID=1277687 RepID=A0A061H422_9BASI|nr:uncharacterized protein PFL1_05250 [Pseudozyma flocculosa PF-1]EPQ27328.1 hypothetical protein PFL1_05250 [Pseudozyma flocculosa PF-1]